MIDATANLASLIDNDTLIIPGHGQVATRQDLLDYRNILVVIRGNLVRARVQGLSPEAMLATEPANGFAPRNENTDNWLLQRWAEMAR